MDTAMRRRIEGLTEEEQVAVRHNAIRRAPEILKGGPLRERVEITPTCLFCSGATESVQTHRFSRRVGNWEEHHTLIFPACDACFSGARSRVAVFRVISVLFVVLAAVFVGGLGIDDESVTTLMAWLGFLAIGVAAVAWIIPSRGLEKKILDYTDQHKVLYDEEDLAAARKALRREGDVERAMKAVEESAKAYWPAECRSRNQH